MKKILILFALIAASIAGFSQTVPLPTNAAGPTPAAGSYNNTFQFRQEIKNTLKKGNASFKATVNLNPSTATTQRLKSNYFGTDSAGNGFWTGDKRHITFADSGQTLAAQASALVELKSISKGFLTPRMTRDQKNAIASPASGLLVYQTNFGPGYYYYTGTDWATVGGSGGIGGTLNDAYDYGGAGAGRTITADAGAVQINGNFRSEITSGLSLINDTINVGVVLPWAGQADEFGEGFWLNGSGDLTNIGKPGYGSIIGYLSLGRNTRITIDSNNTEVHAADMASLITDNGDGWEIGYTAFSSTAACCQSSATMFALREDLDLDVQVVRVDTAQVTLSSLYGVVDANSYYFNRFTVDTTKLQLTWGSDVGGLPPAGTSIITLDTDGFHTTNTDFGIGTATPSADLDLVGTFQYTDGNQAVNKFLRSDLAGNATWQYSLTVGASIDVVSGDAATINAQAGRFRKDATGASFTLTNSFITANSIIILTQANAAVDATGTVYTVQAGPGSATITWVAAPAADFDMNFVVVN